MMIEVKSDGKRMAQCGSKRTVWIKVDSVDQSGYVLLSQSFLAPIIKTKSLILICIPP